MKLQQLHLRSNNLDAINLDKIKQLKPQLGLIFGGKQLIEKSKILEKLKSETDAKWIGCSTAGEITSDGVYSNSITLTAIRFDNPKTQFKIETATIGNSDSGEAAGKEVGKKLKGNDLKFVMIFSPGLAVNGSAIIKGVTSEIGKDVPVTGGLAGDEAEFKSTYTFFGTQTGEKQLIGLGFYGDSITAEHGCRGGWTAFGVDRKVTKSQDNILMELDGQPALDIYKTYLGEHSKSLPGSGLMFPFSLVNETNKGNDLIRTILGIDEAKGSLTLAGDIQNGSTVRLMHASNEGLVSGAKKAAENIAGKVDSDSDSIGVLISCVGRKLVMGGSIDEEVEAVNDVLGDSCVLTGFYSYGEISPFDNEVVGQLHNQTMTITYISEK